jgi:hypothetical protein
MFIIPLFMFLCIATLAVSLALKKQQHSENRQQANLSTGANTGVELPSN